MGGGVRCIWKSGGTVAGGMALTRKTQEARGQRGIGEGDSLPSVNPHRKRARDKIRPMLAFTRQIFLVTEKKKPPPRSRLLKPHTKSTEILNRGGGLERGKKGWLGDLAGGQPQGRLRGAGQKRNPRISKVGRDIKGIS